MSFILDALRKSEHARQHQKGPALAEVPIVPAKPKVNVWAAAAVALLVVNLVAVGVLMLRRAQQGDEAPAVAVATAAAPVGSQADASGGHDAGLVAADPSQPQANPEPTLTPDPQATVTQTPSGALQPIAPPASGTRNPLAAEVSEEESGPDPAMAASAANVPAGPPAVTTRGVSRPGSVTYATLPEANDTPPHTAPAPNPEPRQQEALPTADEVVARGGVPPLHLDLHVYSSVVSQRFIFVNSRKYKEGETLQEGPVIERITVDGAVLNFRGNRFKLSHD